MNILRDWPRHNRAALLLFLAGAGWAVVSLVGAVLLEPLPEAEPGPPTASIRIADQSAAPQTPLIIKAVASNPMRPDRRRAPGRFGQVIETLTPEKAPPVPKFRVAGVARQTRGADLAAIAIGREPPRLVRQGDTIQGFRLLSVDSDSVHVARADTSVGLLIPGHEPVRKAD